MKDEDVIDQDSDSLRGVWARKQAAVNHIVGFEDFVISATNFALAESEMEFSHMFFIERLAKYFLHLLS